MGFCESMLVFPANMHLKSESFEHYFTILPSCYADLIIMMVVGRSLRRFAGLEMVHISTDKAL